VGGGGRERDRTVLKGVCVVLCCRWLSPQPIVMLVPNYYALSVAGPYCSSCCACSAASVWAVVPSYVPHTCAYVHAHYCTACTLKTFRCLKPMSVCALPCYVLRALPGAARLLCVCVRRNGPPSSSLAHTCPAGGWWQRWCVCGGGGQLVPACSFQEEHGTLDQSCWPCTGPLLYLESLPLHSCTGVLGRHQTEHTSNTHLTKTAV
jgi:hypothetical protein